MNKEFTQCLFIMVMLILTVYSIGFTQEYNQVCGMPTSRSQSMTETINSPCYPTNATLKALVIFVRFSDDHYENSPYTDLWPDGLVGLPSWAPAIISPTVQPTYSHPSLSGFFDEMSLNQFQLIGDVYPILYTPKHVQSWYWITNGNNICDLT
jgi:hypothetical protein